MRRRAKPLVRFWVSCVVFVSCAWNNGLMLTMSIDIAAIDMTVNTLSAVTVLQTRRGSISR